MPILRQLTTELIVLLNFFAKNCDNLNYILFNLSVYDYFFFNFVFYIIYKNKLCLNSSIQ